VTPPVTGTVYALVDPRDNRVRYVGATKKPLKVRLNGHMTNPARRIRTWVDALAAGGLMPRIEPITENVPMDDLWDLERAEITRRLIAGERLLNESATAPARRHIERQREQDRIERERAAWEHVAAQVRSIVGGPLAPGHLPPIPLGHHSTEAYHALMRMEDGPDLEVCLDVNQHLPKQTRILLARAGAAKALWSSVQQLWGPLRGKAGPSFDDVLAGRVSAVFDQRWMDLQDAHRYLALLPWGIMAVGPWAALAERAGMDASGSAFIDWVTDDATVREALTILLIRSGGRMGPLSALDRYDGNWRLSTGLVAMTAAHHPGFDLSQELHREMRWFLEWMLRSGQLTQGMADLLLKMDPGALNQLLGPDIASGIDARLGLRPGTSKDVLAAVLEISGEGQLDRLDRIVNRAKGALPTVQALDYRHRAGDAVPIFQAITASLIAAGVLPDTPDAEALSEVRALWCANPSAMERSA
jgi:hypothetical protein